MKKSILAVSVAALFFTACSNSEDFDTPQTQKEIALNPVAQKATRTPIEGASFAADQKIYVSAWNSVSGDYFTNIEFTKNASASGSTWKSGQLWPINGITSFLAYAFNQNAEDSELGYNYSAVDVNSKATWGDGSKDYAKTLTIDFGNNSLCYKKAAAGGTSVSTSTPTPYVDLLYANADQTKEKDYSTVSMKFQHTGAWIEFNVKLKDNLSNATLIINNFSLLNVHKGGKLTIDNTIAGGAKASWDFTSCAAADYKVESFPQTPSSTLNKGLTLSNTQQTFGVILPEQQQTAIQFKYTLSSTASPEAFKAQTATYTHNLDRFEKWEMGKKYVYNITISFKEIEIQPSVTDWGTSTDATVNIPGAY